MHERIDHHNFDSIPPEEREFRQEGVSTLFAAALYILAAVLLSAVILLPLYFGLGPH